MDLAEKGDNLNLDMTSEMVAKKTEDSKEGDLYQSVANLQPRPVFLWGQGFQRDLCTYWLLVPMSLSTIYIPEQAFSFFT